MTRGNSIGTPRAILEARRRAATGALEGGVMVLPAAPVQYLSRDGLRPYHPDRELYYLTGATEPESVAVLVGAEERLVLFVRDRDEEAELWSGERLGPEGTSERLGVEECHPVAELEDRLPALLDAGDRIHYRLGGPSRLETLVIAALGRARSRGMRYGTGPRAVADPGGILDDLRLVKDDHEVALLRRAAEVTGDGHRAGCAVAAPGVGEWEMEAAIDAAFRSSGGGGPGYETIVGSGRNACVLHYVDNAATIDEGDVVLVDAGAQFGLYNGDVTRTYPASGRFSPEQREVYDLVDAARRAAIETVRPGASVADPHDAASRVLAEGLISMGVLDGPLEEVLESQSHKRFFPHQTSHWLGLDVHDPGDYTVDGDPRVLEAGMVFTVEPGLYFRSAVSDTPPELDGLGVRIEDDVLVTADGREVLTDALPTAPDDVEALMGVTP